MRFKEYLIKENNDSYLIDKYKELKKKDFINRKDLEEMTDISFELRRKGININDYLKKNDMIKWKIGKPKGSSRGLYTRKGMEHHTHL
jgi:hypothetical protein